MADKPSYLGTLNAIANGEARGFQLLDCWARTTSDAELAHDLRVVAIREQEHAAAFTKRICELGFGVQERGDPKFAKRLAYAGNPAKSDARKFEKLFGYGRKADSAERTGAGDQLGALLTDTNIDPRTGALLGRFIAEERDSGRRLQAAWQRCEAASRAMRASAAANDASMDAAMPMPATAQALPATAHAAPVALQTTLAELCERMDTLTRQMADLQRVAGG